jgi:peptidoglycan hydrolase-like protein with peptidoglycan-binding domain
MKRGLLSISAPTGYFGKLTQAAVIAFQKANNLPQTGTMTVPANGETLLFGAAASPFSPTALGSTGTRVKSIQQFLIQRGLLNISTTTTYFGPLTKAAVVAFQKAHGIPQTGIIDQATFSAMNGQ